MREVKETKPGVQAIGKFVKGSDLTFQLVDERLEKGLLYDDGNSIRYVRGERVVLEGNSYIIFKQRQTYFESGNRTRNSVRPRTDVDGNPMPLYASRAVPQSTRRRYSSKDLLRISKTEVPEEESE